MDCNNCNRVVPYIVHEADMARMERTIRRLWTTIIVLIASVICLCVGFFIYESQFEEQSITQKIEQDAESGDNSYVGNIVGGDCYGETESYNNG